MAARAIRGIFLDLSGTVFLGEHAIPGAVEAIGRARSAGMLVRFVTNSTELSVSALVRWAEARSYMLSNGLRPFALIEDELQDDFVGVDDQDPNAVLVGLAPDKFDYEHLDRAFNLLRAGAPLLAINKGRYDADEDGSVHMGAGGFVAALEYAAGIEASVLGKPSSTFYLSALEETDLEPSEVIMVGDDVRSDVQGALRAGLGGGALVCTGKYSAGDEDVKEGPAPSFVASDVAEAIDWALSRA